MAPLDLSANLFSEVNKCKLVFASVKNTLPFTQKMNVALN